MIETVFRASLPMGERMVVQRNRIVGVRKAGPRLVVATGLHGDELEGQFVAFELARRLNERLGNLRGTVDIYPALNPLGLSARTHGVPNFDIDLDHMFPGDPEGDLTSALAAAVLDDMLRANACVVVHSSAASMQELAQARIDEDDPGTLEKLAMLLNVRLVWKRAPTLELASTLAHALNERGVPTIVVEMGSGMRVSEEHGVWLVEGILRLLEHLHAWSGPTIISPYPLVSQGDNVVDLVTERPGLFLPRATHGSEVWRGQEVGVVVDPLCGETIQEVYSPCDGLLFSLRAYPLVQPGSLLARVLEVGR